MRGGSLRGAFLDDVKVRESSGRDHQGVAIRAAIIMLGQSYLLPSRG